ncbi:MAG: hypothetical protein ACTHJQ_12915 [Rhizobiaceae bacterium]
MLRRKRPDSLDAYDLVLRAQPDIDLGMPEQVTRALVLLDRAIALEPAYALAHGNAAMCHHCLFLRAGLQETNRAASIRHARSAIVHGQDDALALTWAGFSIGMDAHDRAAAFTALEAALSPVSIAGYTVFIASLIALAFLGALAAKAGGAGILKPTLRVTFWGAAGMAITAAVGMAFGTVV